MELEEASIIGEDKMEISAVEAEVVVEEDDDEDDGPPPGFQCIITPQSHPVPEAENAEDADNEEDDGPPPGFDCITPKPLQSLPSPASSDLTSSKRDELDDDEDGPPPGWEFNKLVNALPTETSSTTDIKGEEDEELDEGPPPGWESVLPSQMPQPHSPTLQLPSTIPPRIEMESKEITPKNDNEVPHSESEHTPMILIGQSSPVTPPSQQLPSSDQPADAGNNDEDKKNEEKQPTSGHQPVSPLGETRPTSEHQSVSPLGEKRPTSEHQSLSPRQPIPSNPHPLTPVPKLSSSGKAQLVCGTCQKLCLYPRGAKWVRCPGCQEVNFVLEAHEVGQVKCGGCTVLLMYPHGAPAVQCTSCRFMTEIGAHNRRPPLSVQQAQARDQRRHRRFNRAR